MKRFPCLLLLPAVLLSFAAPARALAAAQPVYSFPPEGRFTLPDDRLPDLLHQCSRPAPENAAGFWQPSAEELARLEAALPAFLAAQNPPGAKEPRPPHGEYSRQYAGIVVGGKRLIYGNFYHELNSDTRDRSREALIVCDGGPYFWGVVYDPETGAFSALAFNGAAP